MENQNYSTSENEHKSTNSSTMKNEKRCFVGGLALNFSSKSFRNYIESVARVKKITYPKTRNAKKPRGFCIIEFNNVDECQKFLRHKSHKFNGMTLKVSIFVSSKKSANVLKEMQKKKLYLGNLHPNITTNQIHQYFCKYGEIEDIKLQYKIKDGKSIFRRIGFIVMKNFETTSKILKQKSHKICGSSIIVKRAVFKSEPTKKNGANNENDKESLKKSQIRSKLNNYRYNLNFDEELLRDIKNSYTIQNPQGFRPLINYNGSKVVDDKKSAILSSKILKACELGHEIRFQTLTANQRLFQDDFSSKLTKIVNSSDFNFCRKDNFCLLFKDELRNKLTNRLE